MQYRDPHLLTGPGPGPVARFLSGLAAALVLTVSFILGFAFFLVVLGIGTIVGVIAWLKLRRMRQAMQAELSKAQAADPAVLEGEFEVVQREERHDR